MTAGLSPHGNRQSAGSVGELLDALTGWISALTPDAERRARLLAAAREAAPGPDAPVDAAVCARLTGAARAECRLFTLEYVADGTLTPEEIGDGTAADRSPVNGAAPDAPAPHRTARNGAAARGPVEVRRRAGAVTRVERSPDGVATIVLDALDEVALASPYVEAAFALVRGGRGLLLDLRANRGGDPATAALVVGWLLGGARVQLSTVVHAGRERQWWTPGLRADRELAGLPVAVLTSGRTLCAAEALAYHLRARQRATVVGEPTAGAADLARTVALTSHVRGLLPHGYVVDARTGTNWEGTGVRPDVGCPAEDAPARAHALLLG